MPTRVRTAVALSATTAAAAAILIGSLATASADDTPTDAEGRCAGTAPCDEQSSPLAFETPPEGGITVGVTQTSSLTALIEAQPFDVAAVASFDVQSQALRTHLAGGPGGPNALDDGHLHRGDVVFIRRAGVYTQAATVTASGNARPARATAPAGIASPFTAPPPGGITVGQARTANIEAIVRAQRFEVRSISAWDTSTQRWLTYVVGAPASVNSLSSELLRPDLPVFVRRVGAGSRSHPSVPREVEVARTMERITYYFCERGSNSSGWGDGGGFCGHMRNGDIVHEGAAACAPEYLGTRFRIEGDPTARVYTCTDTGGLVGSGHRDVWFANSDEGWEWRRQVGPRATVIVLR